MAHGHDHAHEEPMDDQPAWMLTLTRLAVLVCLFGLMLGLQIFRPEVANQTIDPLTLASIGFTALFAFTVGGLVNSLGLPRVTGYILTGVVLGPSLPILLGEKVHESLAISPILSGAVVQEMQIFNTLALGLIATMAGLELDLQATLRVGRTLAWTVFIKVVALVVLVGGAFVGYQMAFHPFDLDGLSPAMAFGLIFAVLGIGTSPAIVLAVINDLKAKGRFSDLLLAIAVVKDVVVVVALAIAVAVAKAMLAGGGFDSHALVHVAEELGGSILAGCIVGGLIIAYIRFVHAEMLLFVVAMVLVVAQVSQQFHLELLLVFIVAGFLVRNFSPYEHELLHPLEVISLPVFVIFFTTAGADLDLVKSLVVLPIALVLTLARLGALYIAGRFGARLGGESKIIESNGWLAYVPQAGVTLGLVMLTAKRMPEYVEMIVPLGMALVALNLLAGPVTLGLALNRSGEVPSTKQTPEPAAAGAGDGGPDPVEEDTEEAEIEEAELPALPYDAIDTHLKAPDLSAAVRALFEDVEAPVRRVMDSYEEALQRLYSRSLALFEGQMVEEARREAVRRFGGTPEDVDEEAHRQALRETIAEVLGKLLEAEVKVSVPLSSQWLEATGGALPVRLRRAGRRLTAQISQRGRSRHVPLRTLGRLSFEAQHLKALRALGDARYEAAAGCFKVLCSYMDGELDEAAAVKALEARRERGIRAIRRGALEHLRSGAQTLIWLAEHVDTPELSLGSISYVSVEPEIHSLHQELMARPTLWARYFGARRDELLLVALLEGFRGEIKEVITHRLEMPLKAIDDALVRKSSLINKDLATLRADIESLDGVTDEVLRAMFERTRQTFSETMRAQLKTSTAEFRHHALPHHFTDALRSLIAEAPEFLTMLTTQVDGQNVAPIQRETRRVAFRKLLEHQLMEEFAPELLHHHAEALELVSAVPARLSEAVHLAAYAFEINLKGRTRSLDPLLDSVDRAIERIEALQNELREQCDQMVVALDREINHTMRRVSERSRPQQLQGIREESKARATKVLQELGAAFKELRYKLNNIKDQDSIRSLRLRSGVERLAPAQMREYLRNYFPAPAAISLPPRYARLFSLRPLDDRRLFVAHKHHLETLVGIEAAWRRGERGAVLVTGASGSGKTTLMNMFQLELGVNRLIHLYDDFSSRQEGLLAALATELGSAPTVEGLLTALHQEPTAVFVSGLEHWFEPTLEGVERFKVFQDLLVRTNTSTFWTVSIQANALEIFERLFEVRAAFSHHIDLEPLSWQEARQVIEARHQLTDLEWDFKHEVGWRERLTFWQDDDDRAFYFKQLNESSSGNVRALIYHHLRTVQWSGAVIQTAISEHPEIPFLRQLPEEALVMLTQLLRLGAMERRDLREMMKLDSADVNLYLGHLALAGLVELNTTNDMIHVPVHLQEALVVELHSMKWLLRGAA